MNAIAHYPVLVILVFAVFSSPLLAQEEETLTLDMDVIETHVIRVVEATSGPTVLEMRCPENIPQQMGVVSRCDIRTAEGVMSVVIEQTDSEGSVYGTLDDPSASRELREFQDAFVERMSRTEDEQFYDQWLLTEAKNMMSRKTFNEILACRQASMGQISQVQRFGATITPDNSSASLVLRMDSEARPVKIKFFLGPENDQWLLKGILFTPVLPKTLPDTAQMAELVQDFMRFYDGQDWEAALSRRSPEFLDADTRLRPTTELALKRKLLGGPMEIGNIALSITDNGEINARFPVQLENTLATITLSYTTCGDPLLLNGYHIFAEPEKALEISSEQMARTLELELWRNGFGEVAVSCPAFETVLSEAGKEFECRAEQGEEVLRVLVTFKSISGGFDMKMVAIE